MEENGKRINYAFNHGFYKQILQEKLVELRKLRSENKDPYEQISLDESIIFVGTLFDKYMDDNIDGIVENMDAHNGQFNHGIYREFLVNKLNEIALEDFNDQKEWKKEESNLVEKSKEESLDEELLYKHYTNLLATRREEETKKRESSRNKQDIVRELIEKYNEDLHDQIDKQV